MCHDFDWENKRPSYFGSSTLHKKLRDKLSMDLRFYRELISLGLIRHLGNILRACIACELALLFVCLRLDTFVLNHQNIFSNLCFLFDNLGTEKLWYLKAYFVKKQFLRSFTHMHMADQSVFGGGKTFERWKCFQFVFAIRSDQISHLNRELQSMFSETPRLGKINSSGKLYTVMKSN